MSIPPATKQLWTLIPLIGIVLFACLYLVATFHYPGGTPFNKYYIGFSWTENYWCNLLNDQAINGQTNSAQPIASIAMTILCLSLAFFWWIFPQFTTLDKLFQSVIRFCGMMAMGVACLLFTNTDHDFTTNLASFFGLIATTGTLTGLYKNGWKILFYFGILNLLLVVANNVLYYDKNLILYLPLIQKLTFATFLIWVCSISFKIFEWSKIQSST